MDATSTPHLGWQRGAHLCHLGLIMLSLAPPPFSFVLLLKHIPPGPCAEPLRFLFLCLEQFSRPSRRWPLPPLTRVWAAAPPQGGLLAPCPLPPHHCRVFFLLHRYCVSAAHWAGAGQTPAKWQRCRHPAVTFHQGGMREGGGRKALEKPTCYRHIPGHSSLRVGSPGGGVLCLLLLSALFWSMVRKHPRPAHSPSGAGLPWSSVQDTLESSSWSLVFRKLSQKGPSIAVVLPWEQGTCSHSRISKCVVAGGAGEGEGEDLFTEARRLPLWLTASPPCPSLSWSETPRPQRQCLSVVGTRFTSPPVHLRRL